MLEVSDREDGTYAILDGQHRWATANEVGLDYHLVCQVHRGLTPAAEARVFYEIDMRRKVLSGWDRWKARRGSGDDIVRQIENVVTGVGLAVAQTGDGTVCATRALETIWAGGGNELLHNTLFVLTQAYGQMRDAFDGQMLQGVAVVLESYDDGDELDVERLASQLQSIPPRSLKARAQALREAHRAEIPRLCAAVMVERYNAAPGRKLEDLLSRAPAGTKLLNSTGRRSRQLAAIRRWATRKGFRVSDRGRVGDDVLAAYIDSHPGFELAPK